jgi:superoxide reductase
MDMAAIKELFQTADWKAEKHVPVIEAEAKIKKTDNLKITVSVGKEIAHPNTTEHHIVWIEVYFLPKGEKFPYQIARFEFSSHGASTQGPNTSTIYTQPSVTCILKTEKSGTILAASYCNIHGLWENSQELTVE